MNAAGASDGPLRILVCDDEELMRSALRHVLTTDERLSVVGEAATGDAVAPLVEELEPDVVLLDLHMPRFEPFACIRALAARRPQTATLVLSARDEPETIEAALRAGADAYVLKTIDPLDLPAAIRQCVDRTVFQPPLFDPGAPPAASRAAHLSAKEAVVLAELVKGRSNREIAQALWLSEQTVKFHLRSVYKKLGVANRTEALRLAVDRHLVPA